MFEMLEEIKKWYFSINKQQRIIVRVAAFVSCIILMPYTLLVVAPLIAPLMLWLEYEWAAENKQTDS